MNDLELHIKNSKINRFKAVKETLKGLISQDILNHILEPYMVEYPYIDIMLGKTYMKIDKLNIYMVELLGSRYVCSNRYYVKPPKMNAYRGIRCDHISSHYKMRNDKLASIFCDLYDIFNGYPKTILTTTYCINISYNESVPFTLGELQMAMILLGITLKEGNHHTYIRVNLKKSDWYKLCDYLYIKKMSDFQSKRPMCYNKDLFHFGKEIRPCGTKDGCGKCSGNQMCNKDGRCVACDPQCGGKECGTDACYVTV